jgi:putative transposase
MLKRRAPRPPAAQSQTGLPTQEVSWSAAQSACGGAERQHGRIAVDELNRRWCWDGFEIACDSGEKVRVAFGRDCCDGKAMSFLATTGGNSDDGIRNFMRDAVDLVNRVPITIESLSENGSGVHRRRDPQLCQRACTGAKTTPIESPQSNGMTVRTIKCDYVHVSPCPDARSVMNQISASIHPIQLGSPVQRARISFTP